MWLPRPRAHHTFEHSLQQADLQRRGLPAPSTILDVGCSTGISCRWLADAFPEAAITGLDLSPYFLAVALYEQQ